MGRGRTHSVVVMLLALLVLGGGPRVRAAPANKSAKAKAANKAKAKVLFEQGEKLYAAGEFEKALVAFDKANALLPHVVTLFNLARCLDNLGRFAKALATYEKVLAQTKDPQQRAKLQRRIRALQRRPVKVFVTSRPPGATVTVDGRAKPEEGVTPLVTALRPGGHVLVLRAKGHLPAIRRVVVAVGRPQTAAVDLKRQLKCAAKVLCPPPAPACEPLPPPLVKTSGLHLHASVAMALAATDDRGVEAGPAALLHLTLGRILVGLSVGAYITQDYKLENPFADADRGSFRRIVLQAEGGQRWSWRNFYVYAVGGLGISIDRAIFAKGSSDFVVERFAFAWSLGGGIEAYATPWLSLGVGLRLGMGHGQRANPDPDKADPDPKNRPTDEESTIKGNHFFIGQLWATATFHL